MDKNVKYSGMSFKGLMAGGLLAGAAGLGFGQGAPGAGSPETGIDTNMAAEQGSGGGMGGSSGAGQPGQPQAGADQASLPPNVAPGWKIRVCSEKTMAQNIDFRISPAEDKKKGGQARAQDKASGQAAKAEGAVTGETAGGEAGMARTQGQETASWSRGEATLIAVPQSMANMEQIRIETIPAQKDMKSEVCVLYNDHVTKRISFQDRKETTVKMDDNATCGC